tara:strand:+ start:285 stop:548 length:264 start_codon:yes stop_codon:yes gene_type:complete
MVVRCDLQVDNNLFTSAAAYIMGLSPIVEVKGTKEELQVFTEALETSRDVYRILQGGATMELMSEALASKSEKAHAFEAKFGLKWPF